MFKLIFKRYILFLAWTFEAELRPWSIHVSPHKQWDWVFSLLMLRFDSMDVAQKALMSGMNDSWEPVNWKAFVGILYLTFLSEHYASTELKRVQRIMPMLREVTLHLLLTDSRAESHVFEECDSLAFKIWLEDLKTDMLALREHQRLHELLIPAHTQNHTSKTRI